MGRSVLSMHCLLRTCWSSIHVLTVSLEVEPCIKWRIARSFAHCTSACTSSTSKYIASCSRAKFLSTVILSFFLSDCIPVCYSAPRKGYENADLSVRFLIISYQLLDYILVVWRQQSVQISFFHPPKHCNVVGLKSKSMYDMDYRNSRSNFKIVKTIPVAWCQSLLKNLLLGEL